MEEADIQRQLAQDAGLSRAELIARLIDDIRSHTPAAALRRVAAKRRLATEFGRERGWKLAKKRFGLIALTRGAIYSLIRSPADALDDELPHRFFDHPFFYRQNGKATAIAAHLYHCDRSAIAAFAKERSLAWAMPDFPSWWYPKQTRLVVFQKESQQVGSGHKWSLPE